MVLVFLHCTSVFWLSATVLLCGLKYQVYMVMVKPRSCAVLTTWFICPKLFVHARKSEIELNSEMSEIYKSQIYKEILTNWIISFKLVDNMLKAKMQRILYKMISQTKCMVVTKCPTSYQPLHIIH